MTIPKNPATYIGIPKGSEEVTFSVYPGTDDEQLFGYSPFVAIELAVQILKCSVKLLKRKGYKVPPELAFLDNEPQKPPRSRKYDA